MRTSRRQPQPHKHPSLACAARTPTSRLRVRALPSGGTQMQPRVSHVCGRGRPRVHSMPRANAPARPAGGGVTTTSTDGDSLDRRQVFSGRAIALGTHDHHACGTAAHVRCPVKLGVSVGATHQTVLERGTAEHSDRPHRGQASAAKSKSPEQGPSGPRWTRCDNRRNFLYNGRNSPTIRLYTGIRETTHFSNRSG